MVRRWKPKKEKTRDIQHRHFQKRVLQRSGLALEMSDIERIIEDIRGGRTKHIEKQSNTRSVHEVTLGNHTLYVVYDKARKAIVTDMTPFVEG